MTIDVVKKEQLCSLDDEAEVLLISFLLIYYGYASHKVSAHSQLSKTCHL